MEGGGGAESFPSSTFLAALVGGAGRRGVVGCVGPSRVSGAELICLCLIVADSGEQVGPGSELLPALSLTPAPLLYSSN